MTIHAGRPFVWRGVSGVAFAIVCAVLASRCTSSSTEPSSSDPANCKVTLAPVYLALSSNAQTASLNVTMTPNSCSWQASSSGGFVSLSSSGGTGSTTITLSLSANSGLSARTATVTVGDKTLTISQLAPSPHII